MHIYRSIQCRFWSTKCWTPWMVLLSQNSVKMSEIFEKWFMELIVWWKCFELKLDKIVYASAYSRIWWQLILQIRFVILKSIKSRPFICFCSGVNKVGVWMRDHFNLFNWVLWMESIAKKNWSKNVACIVNLFGLKQQMQRKIHTRLTILQFNQESCLAPMKFNQTN